MKLLGAKYIRGMAFVYHPELSREENEKLIFPLMKRIVSFCERNDIIYLCENCGGYAVSSYECMLKLKKEMNSPNFAFVYDTGNVVGAETIYDDGSKELQDPWAYYTYIKDHIDYVHIKDQIIGDGPKPTRTYPGEGEGDVVRILADLINSGYDGIIAIEPHMGKGYAGYIEYGRRTMKIIEDVKKV